MRSFLLKYGYVICIFLIIVILVINYLVLMTNITKEALVSSANQQLRVVIDAGHGGEDGGAVSITGGSEKDINLSIALKTEQIMALYGISPVMTRSTDDIDYPESANTTRARKVADTKSRTELVNNTKNAVLVSIHQNIYGRNTSPHGAQVFYADTDGSEEFAVSLQNMLVNSLDTTNKRTAVKVPDSVYLMNNIKCPAVLIECGFLSNAAECALLETDEYRTKLAAAITAGFINSADTLTEIYWGGINETQNGLPLH